MGTDDVYIRLGTTGNGTPRGANGTYVEQIVCAGGTTLAFVPTGAAIACDIDNLTITPIPTREHLTPGNMIITWELPTIARNGVVADCVAQTVSIEGTANGQVVTFHEAILLPNLIDNPSMTQPYAGVPNIPAGWTNGGLDAGDSQASSAGGNKIHSGPDCIEYAIGASNEGVLQNNVLAAANRFYGLGGFGYTEGGDININIASYGDGRLQNGADPYFLITDAEYWNHAAVVIRAITASSDIRVRCNSGASGLRYADDIYAFILRDINLTVTPASYANCLERGGLRVVGLSSAVQPIPVGMLRATRGRIEFPFVLRHDFADVEDWGNNNPSLAYYEFGALSYVRIGSNVPNMILYIRCPGGALEFTAWNAAATLFRNVVYLGTIEYNPTNIRFYIDGVLRITHTYTGGINFGASIPNTAYWLSNNTGTAQVDAIIAPTS